VVTDGLPGRMGEGVNQERAFRGYHNQRFCGH
jgi:hypothetical protein